MSTVVEADLSKLNDATSLWSPAPSQRDKSFRFMAELLSIKSIRCFKCARIAGMEGVQLRTRRCNQDNPFYEKQSEGRNTVLSSKVL